MISPEQCWDNCSVYYFQDVKLIIIAHIFGFICKLKDIGLAYHRTNRNKDSKTCRFMSTVIDVINVLFFSMSILWMMMVRESSAHKCNEVFSPVDGKTVVGIQSVLDHCGFKPNSLDYNGNPLTEKKYWKGFARLIHELDTIRHNQFLIFNS